LLSALILVPFLVIIFLNLPLKGLRKLAFPTAAGLSLLQIIFAAFYPALFWDIQRDFLSTFFNFRFSFDAFSQMMLIAIGLVLFVSLFVARFTILDELKRFYFVNLLLLAFIGMNATVMMQDLFSLYLFLEVTAIASFIMISIHKDKLGLEGAFKYLLLSAFATVLMLSSIALMLLFSPSLNFAVIKAVVMGSPGSFIIKLSIGLFLCGLLIKSGLFPFHWWLPDAYSAAPSAASVFLAGIVTKTVGVYVLMRLFISFFGYVGYLQQVLMFIGALSIITGALLAMAQSDFKRMLAYSSISQVGYIILATGCATPLAFAAAAFHLFNHANFKSLLFVNAACVEKRLGTTNMQEMGGLGAKMPVTSITSIIAMLSTAGIPPFSGFWSKFLIVLALYAAGNYFYAGLALLASILTLAYLLTLQRKVFFGQLKAGLEGIREVGPGLITPQVVLALVIIFVGIFFPVVLHNFILPLQNIFIK